MGAFSLRNVCLSSQQIFVQNLSLSIGPGDRIGLVAGNGGGKSTLLRCLAGQAEPQTGEIVRARGLTIGLVEQDVPSALLPLDVRAALRLALGPEVRESEAWRVDVALDEFDMPQSMRDQPLGTLSGGWQRLALIARSWVAAPDALLLDEPTNHLDLGKIFRLEAWLAQAARGLPVVVASHDRSFLDAVTNRTLFLRPEESRFFALPYSRARAALAEEDASVASRHEREAKEAQRLRRQAGALKNVGINSGSDLLQKKAKQLRERAEGIEAVLKAAHKDRPGEIRLTHGGAQARVLVAFDDVEVATPSGTRLFRIPKLHVFAGDRLVVLGRNGAGKSRLMALLHQAMPGGAGAAGIRVSPSVVPGHLDQALASLPSGGTPLAVLAGSFDIGDQRCRSLLAAAGFPVEKQERPLDQLSLGQRARLALLVLRLRQPDLYLLDEPTNHVDIAGQEQLEAEILAHGATCILVSHDRHFVRTVGTRFLQIDGRMLREVDSPEPFFDEMAAAG